MRIKFIPKNHKKSNKRATADWQQQQPPPHLVSKLNKISLYTLKCYPKYFSLFYLTALVFAHTHTHTKPINSLIFFTFTKSKSGIHKLFCMCVKKKKRWRLNCVCCLFSKKTKTSKNNFFFKLLKKVFLFSTNAFGNGKEIKAKCQGWSWMTKEKKQHLEIQYSLLSLYEPT